MREKSNIVFDGVILQPLSKSKAPWSNFKIDEDDFLTFFQDRFKTCINPYFNVNYSTEEFHDYLLIPYLGSTFSTKYKGRCFGAYFIKNGEKSPDAGYGWRYIIDHEKSFTFSKTTTKGLIIDEAEFCGNEFTIVGNIDYYELNNISPKFRNFILDLHC